MVLMHNRVLGKTVAITGGFHTGACWLQAIANGEE